MIGKTVGKYRVIDRLGRGGMGTVYKAVDETLDREVAIKVLNPDLGDSEVLKRFRAEAVTLARLNHHGIATLYELHRHQDELLMVMEYVRGETFHDLSARVGPIAPPQASHLCIQVLDALSHAHRAGVVHRDLKPANLMVTEAGTVKVMDFGIARVLGAEHFTYGGYMMGTPAFMAPEQVLGRQVDARADLYAIGVVFYQLLSGHLPFDADTAIAVAQKQVSEPPTPITTYLPELPEWCSDILERALQKAPSARFQSAEEFRAALLGAVRPATLGEMPTLLTPTPPGLRREWDIAAAQEPTRALPSSAASRSKMSAAAAVATPPSQVVTAMEPADAISSGSLASVSQPTPRNQHKTTTVVLGRTHLFAIAGLFIVLVAGMVGLGVVVMKRGSIQQHVPFLGTLPVGTTSAAQDTAAAEPPAEAPPDTPAAPSVADKTAPTAGAGTAKPIASSVPPPASSRPPETTSAPNTAVPVAKPSATVPAPPAAATPANAAPLVLVKDVRLLVSDQDDKGRERQAIMELGDSSLSLVERNGGGALISVPYGNVVGAFYSRSKKPKWRDANGKEVESKVDLGPLGFFRGERNWLILLTAGDPVIIRLEDANLQSTLAQVQERTGIKISR